MENDILKDEYEYYKKQKADLIEKYEKKFVVIKEQKILGIYDNRNEALNETIKNHSLGTFLLHQIIKNEEIAHRFHSRVYC